MSAKPAKPKRTKRILVLASCAALGIVACSESSGSTWSAGHVRTPNHLAGLEAAGDAVGDAAEGVSAGASSGLPGRAGLGERPGERPGERLDGQLAERLDGPLAERLDGQLGELPTAGLGRPLARSGGFQYGVSLGLFVSESDDRARKRYYRVFLDEIAALGARDIQFVVRWFQTNPSALSVRPAPDASPGDRLLGWIVDEAHARGLRVFLLPVVGLSQPGPGQWRGTLAPTDWDAWWRSYTDFVMHQATLAEALGVELLSVGSELLSTEHQTRRWRALIARVRSVFAGRLTYSANWDHFEAVAFWDALDLIGVTGYQALSRADDPSEAQLVRGFQPLRDRLEALAARVEKPFILTEVGYPSRVGAAARPWDHVARGQADPQLQLRCYRALFRAWQAHPWLAGLYVWNWFGSGGPSDNGYTPRGKPAAEVLRHWYGSR